MNFIFFLGVFLLLAPQPLPAQESNSAPAIGATLITNLAQFWGLSAEEKKLPHPARLELLVYYCDPHWNVYWGRSDGLDTFLPLRGLPQPLQGGEKVVIDGVINPMGEEFFWDRTSIKILSRSNAMPPISVQGSFLERTNLDSHFVQLNALVDSQASISSNVLKLGLFAQNFYFGAFVHLANATEPPPDLQGKFVRIEGVYSKSLDAFGRVANVTLWTPGLNDVKVVGSLETDPQFSIPVTSSEKFSGLDPHALVCVRGVVRSQQPGQAVTIWDDRGQIRILTKQLYPLRQGDVIKAVGYPAFQGLERVLVDGLFRLATNTPKTDDDLSENTARLHLADQVRSLDEERLAQRPLVSLEGVVTWAESNGNSIFVSDSSSGIRVLRPQFANGRRIRTGMLVKVDGIAVAGQFAPVITNAVVHQTGIMNLPDAPQVSLEQALAGVKDGCWVQIRGYVREVSVATDAIKLHIVAPGGEFIARVPKLNSLKTLQGSVVLAQGVCVAIANSRRQLTGIELWSPRESDIQIVRSAPEDIFALPEHSIASLRRFNLFNSLNERVHTLVR